ncbi:hypothetical protein Dsin_018964 [Dipteronia sinensis]|uniref:Uncharacterized protein n=1 Tax=Dipteronia sinensis TaxID=43782 RepID=A0AAE0A7R2_9ROSI|nr:hypothetical protein Dsin_018964 [Dipteronia sinensis]
MRTQATKPGSVTARSEQRRWSEIEQAFAQENPRETKICDGEMRTVAVRLTTGSEADGMVDEMTGRMGLTAPRTEIGLVMAARV